MNQIAILGASGDLTARKLIPALVGSARLNAFTRPVQVIGVSRSAKSSEEWRDELGAWLDDADAEVWASFRDNVHYVAADTTQADDVQRLLHTMDELAHGAGADPDQVGRLFYLALKPVLFGPVVEQLSLAGALRCDPRETVSWRRVVVEKPFGTDLATAQALNDGLLAHLREDQILRIDHYLGKETVQNILAFRFQNAIFEPLWNRNHVEAVEITVSEEVGMEGGRGAYYDTAGALRDMIQNHVLQVLALVAMEPPSSMSAEAVRNEKVKVLQSLRTPSLDAVSENSVRAQYTSGPSRDRGYLEEDGVAVDSTTETYAAIRAQIDNWRWEGVPFLLRTGKCMPRRYTEVVLHFRVPPVDLLNGPVLGDVCRLRPNALHLSIQPVEGIRLGFLVKRPGNGQVMQHATLGFDYRDLDAEPSAPAYQRLLLDALEGNATLFIRGDEVEAAWRFADAIRAGWDAGAPVHSYPAGTAGPAAAGELYRGCEGTWGTGEGAIE